MNNYRTIANCMQVSVFLPKIQHFKQIFLVFLNIYDHTSKVTFLKSGHIHICI